MLMHCRHPPPQNCSYGKWEQQLRRSLAVPAVLTVAPSCSYTTNIDQGRLFKACRSCTYPTGDFVIKFAFVFLFLVNSTFASGWYFLGRKAWPQVVDELVYIYRLPEKTHNWTKLPSCCGRKLDSVLLLNKMCRGWLPSSSCACQPFDCTWLLFFKTQDVGLLTRTLKGYPSLHFQNQCFWDNKP